MCVIMNLPALIWDTINGRSQLSYHGENRRQREKERGAHTGNDTMMCSWDRLHVNIPVQHTQAPTPLSCHQSIFIRLQERGKKSDMRAGVEMDAPSTKSQTTPPLNTSPLLPFKNYPSVSSDLKFPPNLHFESLFAAAAAL